MVAIWTRKESEVHLDAAIEVNEIHTPVSRSFVRPKATSPSLPACLFHVLLGSVEQQEDENTPHPVYATAHTRTVCFNHASMALMHQFTFVGMMCKIKSVKARALLIHQKSQSSFSTN